MKFFLLVRTIETKIRTKRSKIGAGFFVLVETVLEPIPDL